MDIIADIIKELADSEKSISTPLLKAKVLASRISNAELLQWVNKELQGYADEDQIPEYRKFSCQLIGDFNVGYQKYYNQQIPTAGLDANLEDKLRSTNFTQSISGLEKLYESSTTGALEMPLAAELTGLIGENWKDMDNPFLQLINARKRISSSSIFEILSIVRNRLLDFVLALDSEFGNITDLSQLSSKQKEIESIMNQTIINNNGDGSIVNTGENANISAKITVIKGDKESLTKSLKDNGVKSVDIQELLEVIDSEKPSSSEKFGDKVNGWIKKMFSKSLDGTWKIGLSTAGGLLTKLIGAYYGF